MLSKEIVKIVSNLQPIQAEIFNEIQESIGHGSNWPNYILKLFFTKGVTHKSRPMLTAFFWLNALHPSLFMSWITEYHCARDELALKEFATLYSAWPIINTNGDTRTHGI